VAAAAAGYVPAFAGPFRPEAGGKIENLRLVLGKGFTGRVRLTDASGAPIAGAELSVQDQLPGLAMPRRGKVVTDGRGLAAIGNCSEYPVQLEVRSQGFQFDRREFTFKPNTTVAWRLQPAKPTTGIVLSEAGGEGIPAAAVRLFGREGFAAVFFDPTSDGMPLLATAGKDGRFRLTTLRDDCVYDLFVTAKGYGCKFVRGVKAGQEALEVKLGPELYVRGRILGPLDKLDGRRSRSATSGRATSRFAPAASVSAWTWTSPWTIC